MLTKVDGRGSYFVHFLRTSFRLRYLSVVSIAQISLCMTIISTDVASLYFASNIIYFVH